ncbi:hypothetical protein NX059_009102 [Plenodomus lindquistii]|nr:hypothetical protein NX059_009102 [Plenodomus lindquistii]
MSPASSSKIAAERPRISAPGATMARVLVGKNRAVFHIHQDLLTHHSPFFRAALTGGFEEAQKNEVVLSDTGVNTFEIFVHWLYYGRFPTIEDNEALFQRWSCGSSDSELLIKIYIFCEKYNAPQLKRLAMDKLFYWVTGSGECHDLPSDAEVGYAFGNLSEESGLCRFIVDVHCHFANAGVWDLTKQDLPLAFLTGVLRRYSAYAFGKIGWDDYLNVCDYHEHQNEDEARLCSSNKRE